MHKAKSDYRQTDGVVRSRTRGSRNPPGTKIAKRVMKARGYAWNGEIFHGGELTLAAFNRNNPFPAKDYAEMLRRRAPSS